MRNRIRFGEQNTAAGELEYENQKKYMGIYTQLADFCQLNKDLCRDPKRKKLVGCSGFQKLSIRSKKPCEYR